MPKTKFISKRAIEHASRGTFIYPKKYRPKQKLTMKSGGHGQENIDFLTRRKIPHRIDTVYSNGVRFGHVDYHKNPWCTKKNGQAWFPAAWDREDIKRAGQHVASLRRNSKLIDGYRHTGRYRGVSVGIVARKGFIKTVFPLFDVNKHARKKIHII